MPGNYGKMFHEKTHDPCNVEAAVFDDGAGRVALIGIDALMVHENWLKRLALKLRDPAVFLNTP
jgi:outer membrane protein W